MQQAQITVEAYMRKCLSAHPRSYYRRQATGPGRDFATAPEISQMFGELLALWFVDAHQQMGQKAEQVRAFIELGVGRGSMAADMQRVFAMYDAFNREMTYHSLDVDDANVPETMQQHRQASTLPDCGWFVVANEFFDSLPTRQFMYHRGAWRERMVAWSEEGLSFVLGDEPVVLPSSLTVVEPQESMCLEYTPELDVWGALLAKQLCRYGGRVLIIDYGYQAPSSGDSLRAIRRGQFCHPLTHVGDADLSVAVNFAQLAACAREQGCYVFTQEQGAFLCQLGIEARAQRLIQDNPHRRAAIDMACYRLVSTAQMGSLFKVMCLSPDRSPPAGFAEA